MSKKKTHEEYVRQVYEINPNIEVVETYVDCKTKIKHKCKLDGYEWFAFPSNILKGHGCRECMKTTLRVKFAKTHEEYVQEVKIVNSDIEVLEEYVNTHVKILHRCRKHNVVWYASPLHILEGCGCIECKGEKIYNSKVKTIDIYKQEVLQTVNSIEVVSEFYINARTPILHRCTACGHIWNASPDNILQGYGCPECNVSKGENQVKEYLIKHHIDYIFQCTFGDCKNINTLPFDFYLPDYNLCIEYDGIQHFHPVEYFGGELAFHETVTRDSIKTNYCLSNNIGLLRIRYDEDVVDVLDQYFNNVKKNIMEAV